MCRLCFPTLVRFQRLRKAARNGDVKKIIELLAQDDGYAVVNDPDPDTHATPLHMACLSGNKDAVTLLRGAGAALESVSVHGTPLHCAASAGHVLVALDLLGACCSVY